MSRILRALNVFIVIALLGAIPTPSRADVSFDVGLSVNLGPPALPYYVQPPCPQPNYVWMPGYWAWGPAGYYWVPGTWVAAAAPGLLWTPGYWGYSGGGYGWNPGYWAPQVGFYGGVNYGFGYFGAGYVGGGWQGNQFRYNTAVTNVNTTIVRNVYVNRTVVNNYYNRPNATHVSYNGGPGGVAARPTASQQAVLRGRRVPLTSMQRQHIATAASNRNYLASVNRGRPAQLAVARPLAANRKPANFTPLRSADRQAAAHHVLASKANGSHPTKAVARAPQRAVQHPAAKAASTQARQRPQATVAHHAAAPHHAAVVHHAAVAHAAPVTHHAAVVHHAPVAHAAPVVHHAAVAHAAPAVHHAPVAHVAHVAPPHAAAPHAAAPHAAPPHAAPPHAPAPHAAAPAPAPAHHEPPGH